MSEESRAAGPRGGDGTPAPAMSRAAGELRGVMGRLVLLRRVAKAMLIGETAAWLGAVWVAGGIGVALADYFLRMPGWLRGGWLGAGAAVALWLLVTRVIPAWRFRPSLTEFALRVERSEAGRRAGLEGVLASAVDMAVGRAGGGEAARAAFVSEAARRARAVGVRGVIRPARIALAVLAAALMGAMVAGFFATQPTLAAIGSMRILAPWSAAEWPRRTDIESAMVRDVHALGQTLSLRAALLSSDTAPDRTRVEARYRIIEASGRAGPVRRVALTSQDRPVEVATFDPLGKPIVASGTLFERLIEPGALEPSEPMDAGSSAELEYWLSSADDETGARRIRLVRPPTVLRATARVSPPAYLASADGAGGAASAVDLGAGNDERATIPAVLRGSRIELEVEFNKALPEPRMEERAWVSALLGEQFAVLAHDAGASGASESEAFEAPFSAKLDGRRLTVSWTVRDSVRLPVQPVDEHGIGSDQESVYRIEARSDGPPEATVTRPAEDTEALPTAVLDVAAEARDDVALESVESEWRLARRAPGSEGAAPEPTGEPVVLARRVPETPTSTSAGGGPGGVRVLTVESKLDVASTGAASGDELWITALAKDLFELNGVRHEATRSAVRRVRIISKEQLVEQVWQELGAVRRSTIRMAEQQDGLRSALERGAERAGSSRDQAAIGDGAEHQGEAVGRLSERVRANGLDDPELAGVLEDAEALLERAREAAREAAGEMRRGEQARAQGDEAQAEAARAGAQARAERAQQALEQLAELLDKGEDAWSVRRGVERLLEEQREVREQTARLGEQTTGKTASELSPAQAQQAGQLSERQGELAERGQEVLDRLRQAAEQMSEQDPEGARALDEAARRAERARMQEQMQEAARDIAQNRQQSATQQQDRAMEAMEQVLDQMQQAQRSRDEVLQRELASLVQSLEALIRRQELELAALGVGEAGGGFEKLDEGMIALRQNTLGVLELARAAGREARDAAALIESAAEAQSDAATALRARPVDAPGARTGEERSLERLKAARDQAEEARQDAQARNNRRQLAELRKAYRELLDAQLDLRSKTRGVEAMEEGRRKRAAARDLSPVQDQIRQKAADLGASTSEIEESTTFGYAQTRLEEAVSAAAARLAEGEADRVVLSRQNSAIRVLQSILEALSDQDRNADEFREQAGGDQGSGGSGGQQQQQGLIPPGAELKLLRSLQGEALAVTREAAESGDADLSHEASTLQKELLERARAVLEELERQQRGGGPEVEPDDEPAMEPVEEANP